MVGFWSKKDPSRSPKKWEIPRRVMNLKGAITGLSP